MDDAEDHNSSVPLEEELQDDYPVTSNATTTKKSSSALRTFAIIFTLATVVAFVVIYVLRQQQKTHTTPSPTHTTIPPPHPSTHIVSIACGMYHSIVVTSEGKAYACGDNTFGQLGLGAKHDNYNYWACIQTEITEAADLFVVSAFCGAFYTFLMVRDNPNSTTTSMRCFGQNKDGQLGIGTTSDKEYDMHTPVLPSGAGTPAKLICNKDLNDALYDTTTSSLSSTLVIDSNGNMYGCGANTHGQLATGTKVSPVPTFTSATQQNILTAGIGLDHTVFVVQDIKTKKQTVYVCGNNAQSQLGLSNNTAEVLGPELHTLLTQLTAQDSIGQGPVVQVECTSNSTNLVFESGAVVRMGANTHGQLGIGSAVAGLYTLFPSSQNQPWAPTSLLQNITDIACGINHVLAFNQYFAVNHRFAVFGWGDNSNAVLGLGSYVGDNQNALPALFPVFATNQNDGSPGLKTVRQVSTYYDHTFVLFTDNSFYGFGNNRRGQLGFTGKNMTPTEILVS